jgi:hypothetical protein
MPHADLADVSLSTHWAFSPWIIALLFLLAIALVAYLYHAQRRIASRRAIITLTALRIALLALVVIVLAQPALRWIRTTNSAGTLWLMLDDSESMTMTDPQASPVERLRWADALGILPEGIRISRPDRHLAQFSCLRDQLLALRPMATESASTPTEVKAQVEKFIAAFKDWHDAFNEAIKAWGKDPAAASAGDINKSLEETQKLAVEGQSTASSHANLHDAVAAVPWNFIQTNLDAALRDLKRTADSTDAEFLRTHQTDSDVQDALVRVSKKSRADLAYELLTAPRTGKTLASLVPSYHTHVVAIGNSAQEVQSVEAADYETTIKTALAPTKESTNLAAGFSLIGQQTAADEPASVIVISDGRQTVKDDPIESARLLASRGVKVYTLMVGSRNVSPDAAVDNVDNPDWIYKDDTLRATARIRLDGLAGQRIRVDFLRGTEVLDTQYASAATGQETLSLSFSDKPPEGPGFEYQVRVADVPGEINHENNRQSFRVAVKKDKLVALMIEDQPRWEYRYLATYLGRDPRVKLQTVLLHPAHIEGIGLPPPAKASADNPHTEAQILPEGSEWQSFDLIVLGDIAPDALPVAQQQQIAAAVRDRGATLIVLAGQQHMPADYANTPLADLLPISLGNTWPADVLAAHLKSGFRPARAPGSESGGAVLSRFGIDDESNTLLWSKVPNWYWHSDQTVAKPNANVIWYISEPEGLAFGGEQGGMAAAKRRALLATDTLGLGRVLYLASDQTWRLRQVAGENVEDRFWGQVIRWAVGNDLPAGGRFVRFGANRPRYQQGDPLDPVVVTAHVLHEDLTPNLGQSIQVIARLLPANAAPGAPGRQVGSATMVESTEAPGYYKASLGNLPAGDIELSLQGPEVERLLNEDSTVTQRTITVKVEPQMDLERRNMNTDPKMMATLAQLGGGFALDGPYADVLAARLPQLHRTITHVEEIGFFGDPKDRSTYLFHYAFLALFITLITAEWIVRKVAGLV